MAQNIHQHEREPSQASGTSHSNHTLDRCIPPPPTTRRPNNYSSPNTPQNTCSQPGSRSHFRPEPSMASPSAGEAPNGISTPPTNTHSTALGNPSPPTTQTSATMEQAPSSATNGALPAEPATSIKDDGLSTKRPRDARLIHLLLAAQGVQSYQERVPLMIMDFAYRYTSGILSDAMALTADGYGMPPSGRSAAQEGTISLKNLNLSIGSRQNYQFQPTLPKEVLLELAQEKNRVQLPKVEREFGYRLPPERYTLTGSGWSLKEEWESEEDEELVDQAMGDVEGGTADQEEVDEDEFEDVMGGGQDSSMKDV